jgi:hypothetical protein
MKKKIEEKKKDIKEGLPPKEEDKKIEEAAEGEGAKGNEEKKDPEVDDSQ